MATALFRLIVITLILGFACYAYGFVLRKFVPSYKYFQYRLSLPIVACCLGSIAALLLITQMMSLFLIGALWHLSFVRQNPELILGTLNIAGYAIGGYVSTKYSFALAKTLDLRSKVRMEARDIDPQVGSLSDVRQHLFRKNE